MPHVLLLVNTHLAVPQEVAVCPYCETALTVTIEACTEEDDGWVASEITVDCETEPDMEEESEAWLKRHYRFQVTP